MIKGGENAEVSARVMILKKDQLIASGLPHTLCPASSLSTSLEHHFMELKFANRNGLKKYIYTEVLQAVNHLCKSKRRSKLEKHTTS
jgi:hypothetical protein